MGQVSEHNVTLALGLSEAVVKVLAKARASYEGLTGEAWLPRSLLAGRVHFFEGCWTDGLNSLVTGHPQFLARRSFHQSKHTRVRVRMPARES